MKTSCSTVKARLNPSYEKTHVIKALGAREHMSARTTSLALFHSLDRLAVDASVLLVRSAYLQKDCEMLRLEIYLQSPT